jgi:hypothetical protein
MKLNPWIFPALAILAIGCWIGSQKKAAATLEKEMHIITERIRLAGSTQERNGMAIAKADRNKISRDKNGKIDIKSIAEKIAKNGYNSEANESTFSQLYDLLQDATVEELCAQLDEIAALESDEETRQRLRSMVIHALADKDPEYVLTRFAAEAGDDVGYALDYALGKLADKDPLAAAAWLDQQIADGKLESKSLNGINEQYIDYESVVVKALMDSDPEAAALRMKAMTEKQRLEILCDGCFMFQMKQSSEASFGKLVRESIPAEKAGSIFAHTVQMENFTKDFDRVDGFIANVKATAAETNAIVEQVMIRRVLEHGRAGLDMELLEKTRTWATSHSPQEVDKVTGKILAFATNGSMDFDKVAEIALTYSSQSGNDEVLTAFLKSPIRKEVSPETLKSLIEKIKDPVIKEEIVNLPQFRTLLESP